MIFRDAKRQEFSLTNFFDLGEDHTPGVYYGIFYGGALVAVTASEWRAKNIAEKIENYEVKKLYHVG